MDQPIVGYHRDAEQHWVAQLACGHTQHVRHEPPLMTRPWVLTDEGREAHLGTVLNCVICEYEDARMRGLCEDGADEARRPSSIREDP